MLAINGGRPVRREPWPKYPILGEEEYDAVKRVLDRGQLVSFRASEGPWFLGGEEVQAFEHLVAEYHGVDFAVSFTSATTALHGAIVGVGVEPLDEVIVTPYSFNTSATCPLFHNAVPVFADVNDRNFCLDVDSVRERITERTTAIVVVHLFGGPADMDELLELAAEHNLAVIEDSAQAPGAMYKGRHTGTMGDCGVFSFVGEKNVSCGEGGMLITDSSEVARKARLLRNHGDALYEPMLGYNYRMTEYQAAIGAEQWKKLDSGNERRRKLGSYLRNEIEHFSIPGICIPQAIPSTHIGTQHSYYAYPFLYDATATGIPRDAFVEAVKAEGIPIGGGYIKPLHLLPLFSERAHFAYAHYEGEMAYETYKEGACPTAEELWRERMMVTIIVRPPATERDMDDIVTAFQKVIEHSNEFATEERIE